MVECQSFSSVRMNMSLAQSYYRNPIFPYGYRYTGIIENRKVIS